MKKERELKVIVKNPPTEEQKAEMIKRIEDYLSLVYSQVEQAISKRQAKQKGVIIIDEATLKELTDDFCLMIAKILIIEEDRSDLDEKQNKTSLYKRND